MEDESTGAVDNIIVKKEESESTADGVGLDQQGGVEITVEGVGLDDEDVDDSVQTVEVNEETAAAAANGDLTPEMILSMMDR